MNKVLKLALSTVLGMTLVSSAFAQSNFPDVPENHWAYQALSNLKDKVLFGYPDGFYRGSRMMSRYEFAVAINQLWTKMMGMFDETNGQIDALKTQIEGMKGGDGDLSAVKNQLTQLQNQVNGMKDWGTAISDLQKLSAEFKEDLRALGADMEAMEEGMSDLKKRVEALENKKDTIKIGANVDALVLASHSSDDRFGLLPSGQQVGGQFVTPGVGVIPAGLDRTFSVFHNVDLTLSNAKPEDEAGLEWNATLSVGNMFGGIGSLANPGTGNMFNAGNTTSTSIVFTEMWVGYQSELVGQGVDVKVGRFGKQVGPYIWQRPAYSHDYYKNELRDSGDWIMDGLELGFNFGPAKLGVFAGRTSNQFTSDGIELNGSNSTPPGGAVIPGSGLPQDFNLGVQLDVPVGDNGDVTLAYLWQDSQLNTMVGVPSRREVFGADANFSFDKIKFTGSFAQTNQKRNNTTIVNKDNTAYNVGLGYDGGNFMVNGGYRRVEGNFAADGAWGRLGTLWNPTNIEGFNVGASFNASEDLKVYGKGEFVKGAENGMGILGKDDDVTSYTVGIGYKVSNYFDLGLKYEDVKFDFQAGNDPNLRWFTVELGYNVAENAKLMFTYIYSDVDLKGRAGLVSGAGLNGRYTGGLVGTQLSVKF